MQKPMTGVRVLEVAQFTFVPWLEGAQPYNAKQARTTDGGEGAAYYDERVRLTPA